MKAINITSDEFKEGLRLGKEQTKEAIKEMIEEFKQEKVNEYEECKLGRTTRMKNSNSKNWGMVRAEYYIETINKLLSKIGDNSNSENWDSGDTCVYEGDNSEVEK
jgi:hypothetical protein